MHIKIESKTLNMQGIKFWVVYKVYKFAREKVYVVHEREGSIAYGICVYDMCRQIDVSIWSVHITKGILEKNTTAID